MTSAPPRSPSPVLIEIEDEAGARKGYIDRFSGLCDDFFNHGHLHSEMILGMVEFSKSSPESSLQVNWEILESRSLGGKDRELVMEWLEAIGIPGGTWLYPEDLPIYIEAKRQRRSAWHEQAAVRLQRDLEGLIFCHLQASAKKTGNGSLSTLSMLLHLNHFLSRFHTHLGAPPIIRGLRAAFQDQMRDPTRALVWVLDDATLTQSGSELMAAAVSTLISTLGFKPRNPDAQGQREWLVNIRITQFQLSVLIRLIDTYKIGVSGIAGSHRVANPPVDRHFSYRSWFWIIRSCFSLLSRPLARVLVTGVHLTAFILPNYFMSLL